MKRLFSRIKCNILGWHKPDEVYKTLKGDILARCKYCGKIIKQDKYGNWYIGITETK